MVRDSTGKVVPGATVLAWTRYTGASIEMEESTRTTRSDEQGAFKFVDLERGRRYTLSAGNQGYITVEPARLVAVGASAVDLVLQPIYGGVLRIRTSDGQVPRLDGGLGRGTSFTWKGFRYVRRASAGLIAAGVDPAWVEESNRYDQLYVFTTTGTQQSRSAHFSLALPGYEPTGERELPYSALLDGLSVHDVVVEEVAAEWGSLEVLFVGGSVDKTPTNGLRPAGDGGGELILTPMEEQRAVPYLKYRFGRQSAEGVVIDSVPAGVYGAEYKGGYKTFRFPPSEENVFVTVRDEEQAQLVIDLTGSGSVELQALDQKGQPVTGQLVVALHPSDYFGDPQGPHWVRYVDYAHAPYILEGLNSSREFAAVMYDIDNYRLLDDDERKPGVLGPIVGKGLIRATPNAMKRVVLAK
ncbi:MAG: carboxypeptidase regulatory-like domain-containing protein [bacterium]|nr:carboxypeptidase regulatory-like domain-containing protein [bacterium]